MLITGSDNASFSSDIFAERGVFSLATEAQFLRWCDRKLAHYPSNIDEILVEIRNPFALTLSESSKIIECCQRANMAIYKTSAAYARDKTVPLLIAQQLGLTHIDKHLCGDEDGIASIKNGGQQGQLDYIPYTNKPINWHTDGYYNPPEHTIYGMVLHCANGAAAGGENAFIDHELVYLYLREKNPLFIQALMQEDVMTIPPNIQNGEIIRDTQSGPVFSLLGETGHLHMRYSARAHNIIWKDEAIVREAIQCLASYLESASTPVFHHLMQPGEGIICNNVLHKRERFNDDTSAGKERLVYRARYYNRVTG